MYFSRLDLFAGGIPGAISFFLFFYAFSFTSVRGHFEHPWEKAVELLVPAFVAGLFLNYLGIPQIIVGSTVLVIYLIFAKWILNLDNHAWTVMVIKVIALFSIFGLLDLWSRNILFAAYLGYNFIISEKKINDKQKGKKDKE